MKLSKRLIYDALVRKYRFIYRHVAKNIINDKILFSNGGFKHLLRRGNKFRDAKDMRHRLSLIPLIPHIMNECPEPIEIRGEKELIDQKIVPVRYYAFEILLNDRAVRMITRQVADETMRFQSLFEVIF